MKTRRKNIFRRIKSSFSRFLAILFIVALGSGFMAGLAATSPDMLETADTYFDDTVWYDLDIKCPLGFTDEDVIAASEIPDVDMIVASRVLDLVYDTPDTSYTCRVYGLLDKEGNSDVNKLRLLEGRMPQNNAECVVQTSSARYTEKSAEIGNVITLSEENEDYDSLCENLAELSLTVVGIVESPMSIAVMQEPTNVGSGSVGMHVFTQKELFEMPYYTDLYVTLRGAKEIDTFSDDYRTISDKAETAFLSLGEKRGVLRAEMIRKDIEKMLNIGVPVPMAEELLASLDGTWIVRTRRDSEGFASYDSNVSKVSALAKIFPVFFFSVALLVALTTMTRLVEENRTEAGTLKALGYANKSILGEYLLYAALSSVLGCTLGFAVGFRIFPYAIYSAYSMMYTLPSVVLPIRWNIVAWVAPVTVGSILIAAVFACFDEFRSLPASLMQPKAPPAGKRILFERIPVLWKHLSFSYKVTCRNLFRYKKRLFMTLLGVAGCTALLLTGFGVRDSVSDIVELQFGEIYKYELTLVTDGSTDDSLDTFLSDGEFVSASLTFHSEDGRARANGGNETVTLSVPEKSENFSDFIVLRNRKTKEAVPFPENGVVLTEKLCETLGVGVGDTVTLEDSDGHRAETTVSGITENYLTSFAYLSAETYETLFGVSPDFDSILCTYSENASPQDAVTRALESASVLYASSSTSLRDTFSDSIKSINGVVWVLIIAAGLLSVVVLYSLTYVNICERRKELSTIAVLGFYEREVESYIFRETNILSFVGSLLGLLIGVRLHSYVVRTVEVEQVMFGRNVYLPSYLYAILISAVFTLLVNELLRKKIRGIDMVEAMKAND